MTLHDFMSDHIESGVRFEQATWLKPKLHTPKRRLSLKFRVSNVQKPPFCLSKSQPEGRCCEKRGASFTFIIWKCATATCSSRLGNQFTTKNVAFLIKCNCKCRVTSRIVPLGAFKIGDCG